MISKKDVFVLFGLFSSFFHLAFGYGLGVVFCQNQMALYREDFYIHLRQRKDFYIHLRL